MPIATISITPSHAGQMPGEIGRWSFLEVTDTFEQLEHFRSFAAAGHIK